ncbi:MAG: 3-methyladenine glycosylase [Pedosphaera sp.]|nr:3-methyladenine glycosylase [Pedosphaera sp.]
MIKNRHEQMNKFNPLPRKFYEPSAEVVAPQLLGHWLIRKTPQGICGGAIVETEAYLVGDPAAHSYVGLTERNRIMWGPPGHSYVYFIYGNHYCFNAVCHPAGSAEAVLVRAIEPRFGLELMQARRVVAKPPNLTNGPGKLCAAMDIDRSLDGVDLCDGASPLFIGQNPELKAFLEQRGPVVTTTRIGINKAAAMPLRFFLGGSAFVSGPMRRNK